MDHYQFTFDAMIPLFDNVISSLEDTTENFISISYIIDRYGKQILIIEPVNEEKDLSNPSKTRCGKWLQHEDTHWVVTSGTSVNEMIEWLEKSTDSNEQPEQIVDHYAIELRDMMIEAIEQSWGGE